MIQGQVFVYFFVKSKIIGETEGTYHLCLTSESNGLLRRLWFHTSSPSKPRIVVYFSPPSIGATLEGKKFSISFLLSTPQFSGDNLAC